MPTRKAAAGKKVGGRYHHGDLKASLKKAALHLVREKGTAAFSLNEASRLAGVTVAAPYRHFADKDALLAEIACDGCELMARELTVAIAGVTGTREQMLEAGMAYLRFSASHADYFAVIFEAGLNRSLYPKLERSSKKAFEIIWNLAHRSEKTADLAARLAVSAWALVHGLATLTKDGALSTAMEGGAELENLRPVLWQFLQ